MAGEFKRWYLEQTSPDQLKRSRTPQTVPQLVHAEIPSPTLNQYFYTTVGADWKWKDRLPWTYEQWKAYVEKPQLQTWVLQVQGTPAGYLELDVQPDGNTEIAYFGLLKEFTGRGIGGWFLGESIARAWDTGARRVWVHTCSYDHPAALANYEARGMRVFKIEDKY